MPRAVTESTVQTTVNNAIQELRSSFQARENELQAQIAELKAAQNNQNAAQNGQIVGKDKILKRISDPKRFTAVGRGDHRAFSALEEELKRWLHKTGLTREEADKLLAGDTETPLSSMLDLYLYNILDNRLDASIMQAIEKSTPPDEVITGVKTLQQARLIFTQNPVQQLVDLLQRLLPQNLAKNGHKTYDEVNKELLETTSSILKKLKTAKIEDFQKAVSAHAALLFPHMAASAHLHIANAHNQNYTTFVETLRSLDGMKKRKGGREIEENERKRAKISTYCLHCGNPNHGIATCRLADKPAVSLPSKLHQLRQNSKDMTVTLSKLKEVLEFPNMKPPRNLKRLQSTSKKQPVDKKAAFACLSDAITGL